ncbi:MAG: hypothetical protein II508_00560 [Acholeplasmatales bacterium]|nr:hypothetical protein [Acholeplasmatales bacterium]
MGLLAIWACAFVVLIIATIFFVKEIRHAKAEERKPSGGYITLFVVSVVFFLVPIFIVFAVFLTWAAGGFRVM